MNGLLHIILNNINLQMWLALHLPQSVHSFRPEENLAGISKTLNIQWFHWFDGTENWIEFINDMIGFWRAAL